MVAKADMFNPLLLLILFPVLIAGFITFDKLVRLEYSSHRTDWEEDGKPHGFFWVPTESKSAAGWLVNVGSSAASWRTSFAWLFFTPEWVRGDEKALRLIFWLRILVFTWNLGTIGAVVVHVLL